MPFIAIAIRNSNLYSQLVKESHTNKVLLELATIVFDESSTSVDNLVSRILFNSMFLLECEKSQIVLLNNTQTVNSKSRNLNETSIFPSTLLNRNNSSTINVKLNLLSSAFINILINFFFSFNCKEHIFR